MMGIKKLSYDYKLPSRSIAEVHDQLAEALARHQRGRSLLFNGRKLSAEGLMNAVLMHFLSLGDDDQRLILEAFIPKLESMLAEEDSPAAASAPEKARVTIQEVTPDGPPSEPFPVDKTGVIIPRPKPPRKHRRA